MIDPENVHSRVFEFDFIDQIVEVFGIFNINRNHAFKSAFMALDGNGFHINPHVFTDDLWQAADYPHIIDPNDSDAS